MEVAAFYTPLLKTEIKSNFIPHPLGKRKNSAARDLFKYLPYGFHIYIFNGS